MHECLKADSAKVSLMGKASKEVPFSRPLPFHYVVNMMSECSRVHISKHLKGRFKEACPTCTGATRALGSSKEHINQISTIFCSLPFHTDMLLLPRTPPFRHAS